MTVRLINHNEALIDAVVARLEAELPALIAELNAADDKQILLEGDPVVYDYVPAVKELNRFPAFAIQDEPAEFEDDTGFGATGVHDLTVIVYDQAPDQRTLAWSLRRYARIVASILLDGRRLEPAWGVTLNAIVPGPTLSRSEEPREWMSWCAVSVKLRIEEYAA